MADTAYDVTHLLDGTMLLLSFVLLYQRRLSGVLRAYAAQAVVLGAAAAWSAHVHDEPRLYITALVALVFKAGVIPLALGVIIRRFGIERAVDTALGIGQTMVLGAGLSALAIVLVLPVTAAAAAIARENLALALSVVLLALLMMITRRNAITQVVGFMSLENGLFLAAVGVSGMPMVVEMSIAFSVMVAFIIFGIFFFHIRERFDTLDLHYVESFRGEQQ